MYSRLLNSLGVLALLLFCGIAWADANLMYWGDRGINKIQRANLDGSNVEDVVTGYIAWGIALDPEVGKVYWISGGQSVRRADLDGSNVESLVTDLVNGRHIALDLRAGKMYWTEIGPVVPTDDGRIRRADLDGTNVEIVFPTGNGSPFGIALDLRAGKLYFSSNDGFLDRIQRANLDGSNLETIYTSNPNEPVLAIAVDPSFAKVYWTESNPDELLRANLNGTGVQTLIEPPISLDTELAVEFRGPGDRRSNGEGTREQPRRGPAA